MRERLAVLSTHVTELEEDLYTAREDLIKSKEVSTKLQRGVLKLRLKPPVAGTPETGRAEAAADPVDSRDAPQGGGSR